MNKVLKYNDINEVKRNEQEIMETERRKEKLK